ncbi:MAG: hypothetical protein HY301_16690 [Verrucomicrobia bacterium]|nr:hypothetical protein [Verrucomicrobiota bacterium]
MLLPHRPKSDFVHRLRRWIHAHSFILALVLAANFALSQEAPPQMETVAKVRGPFYSGSIRWRDTNDVIALKGIVITVGEERNAYVCYDADLVRLSLGWIGDGKKFGLTVPRFSSPPPMVQGTPVFGTRALPGWAKAGSLADPREKARGPLPKEWAHHQGLYVHGRQVVLKYTVGATELLECPGFERAAGIPVFTRTIQSLQPARDLALNILSITNAQLSKTDAGVIVRDPATGRATMLKVEGARDAEWELRDDSVVLKLATVSANQPFRILIASLGEPTDAAKNPLRLSAPLADLRPLTKGGPPVWPQAVVTKGVRAADTAAYVVDRIAEPAENPWKADILFGGFDFFSDGRAAVCTMQGEVWVVSGIDDSLAKLSWRRFASGLFQGQGLKIVNDQVYVVGRDQITRLHDLNGDGEADFYENFNNDTIVSPNPAEYCLDLQTDRAGNFYFAKCAPWFPNVTTPHQGVLFKVSADGARSEIIATGLRAPNGMAIGPHDEITISDNEGHWQPASKLNWIQRGGFYGMVPTAQRELTFRRDGANFTANPSDPDERAAKHFRGWGTNSPMPSNYDKPIAWLPMNMDNSSGGQVWATGGKWGPLNDQLLFMSYGKCAIFATLLHDVAGQKQAAMVPLPLKFDTGIMRGRVHPRDGQVYVAGLRGWLTSAVRPGGLYRVRYTGKPAHLPVAFAATRQGVQLTFSDPLDAKSVADTGNYGVERWNYYWSGTYGSKHYSVSHPREVKHDALEVAAAHLSADGKTISLAIRDMRPSDQLLIKLSLDAADGTPVNREVYATVPVLEAAEK